MNFYRSLGFLVFGSRLKRLSDVFLNDVNTIYKKQKIAFDASWFPVFYILSAKKQVTIREISEDLNISHSAASQLISGLQLKGLLTSVQSKTDARKKAVSLTVKGEKLLLKIKPVWDALEKAMEQLAAEGKESKKILKSLEEMEKNMEQKSVLSRVESLLK